MYRSRLCVSPSLRIFSSSIYLLSSALENVWIVAEVFSTVFRVAMHGGCAMMRGDSDSRREAARRGLGWMLR